MLQSFKIETGDAFRTPLSLFHQTMTPILFFREFENFEKKSIFFGIFFVRISLFLANFVGKPEKTSAHV